MRRLPAILFSASLFAPSGAAFAEPVPDFVKAETAYAPNRAKLENAGWTAHGTVLRQDGGCTDTDQRCIDYPEARECSGTGMGFCNMVWKHDDGTILVIVKAGEEDLGVVSLSVE